MDYYVQLFIYIIVIAPISLLWHELGHVFGARIVQASHIVLTLGIGKPIFKQTYSNITFVIRRLFLFHSLTESQRSVPLSNKDKIVITCMGPISSLVLSLLAYGLSTLIIPHKFLYILCLFNLWVGFVNLVPFKINESKSDGYTILQMIKSKVD